MEMGMSDRYVAAAVAVGQQQQQHQHQQQQQHQHQQLHPFEPATKLVVACSAASTVSAEHVQSVPRQCFGCRVCGCEFVDRESLRTHVAMRHAPPLPRKTVHLPMPPRKCNFVCAICKKQCVTQLHMIMHLNKEHLIVKENNIVELQPYLTAYLKKGKRIISNRNKQTKTSRISTHKNKKPTSKLLVFLKIKWAKRIWYQMLHCRRLSCCLCYKSCGELRAYNSRAALEVHKLSKHANKIHHCTFCMKNFKHLYQLQLHKNIEHREA